MARRLTLRLDAVIVAVTAEQPRILTKQSRGDALASLPFGPLDSENDLTLDRGLRRWVAKQTGLEPGYVEQLYTFGDRDRRRDARGTRLLSVAYLGLIKEAQPAPGAAWIDCYGIFPWEDRRQGVVEVVSQELLPALARWAGRNAERRHRVDANFGKRRPWDPIRVLERYELLYEARLVPESLRDLGRQPDPGLPAGIELAHDHRRIAATALGRLRGKLKYRPVVFELLPETFTLFRLQRTVEALTGMRLHKQNFRRMIAQGRFLEATGTLDRPARGRPAELFRFRREVVRARVY
ncbi:MAG: NUDIX hydrolase [Steroidobacteraceae bacterium]